jgi:hypothetical protein
LYHFTTRSNADMACSQRRNHEYHYHHLKSIMCQGDALITVVAPTRNPEPLAERASPARRPWSIRRTSTIDMAWPDGERGPLQLTGRARDLLTGQVIATADVLASESVDVVVSPARVITSIRTNPPQRHLGDLVGTSIGSGFRGRLAAAAAAELSNGALTHLMLDDLVGSGIVSEFALRQWSLYDNTASAAGPPRRVIGVCTGFRQGSTALTPDGSSTGNHRTLPVGSLVATDDPIGWHEFPEDAVVSMRRARRIDIHVDGEIHIDSMFQDSSTSPERGRVAVHEYRLLASADATTGELTSIDARPRTLPYAECPLAVDNVSTLVGTRLHDLRTTVGASLRGTSGCTHLNDALRALADVPGLVRRLAARPG